MPLSPKERKLARHRRAAERGDAAAQFRLACVYDFEPPKQRRIAERWYRAAALQDHGEAANFLGEMTRDGLARVRGAAARRAAARWFRVAAHAGDPEGQLNYGYVLRNGQGVRRNLTEACRWYRRAARNGNAAAASNLAQMHRRGEGVSRDGRRAALWYHRAEESGGSLWSKYWLARWYSGYDRGPERPRQAAKWWSHADTGRCGGAACMREWALRLAAGRGVARDLPRAREFLRRSARGGDRVAKAVLRATRRQPRALPRVAAERIDAAVLRGRAT